MSNSATGHSEVSAHAARHDADRCLKLKKMSKDALEIAGRIETMDEIALRYGVQEHSLATTPRGHTTLAFTRGGDGRAFLAEIMKDHEITEIEISEEYYGTVEMFMLAPSENEVVQNLRPVFRASLDLDAPDLINTKTHFPDELRKVHA